jgi:SAM-dependent methyltransferase
LTLRTNCRLSTIRKHHDIVADSDLGAGFRGPPFSASAEGNVTVFDRLANQYDQWFDSEDGRPVFEVEIACLKDLMPADLGDWLEVGVGSGRFAQELGVKEGVDPSAPMLEFAHQRGVHTKTGWGEDLPYPDGSFDGVLLVVTLCFLSDPATALRECARVLKEGGYLVIGFVPAGSPWARLYKRKGRTGHPFYSVAKFYDCDRVIDMADTAGFKLNRPVSCLFSPPGEPVDISRRQGIWARAGFVAMEFAKGSRSRTDGE